LAVGEADARDAVNSESADLAMLATIREQIPGATAKDDEVRVDLALCGTGRNRGITKRDDAMIVDGFLQKTNCQVGGAIVGRIANRDLLSVATALELFRDVAVDGDVDLGDEAMNLGALGLERFQR